MEIGCKVRRDFEREGHYLIKVRAGTSTSKYELASRAEKLLNDLDIGHGDPLPWDLFQYLLERDYLTVSDGSHVTLLRESPNLRQLTTEQFRTFWNFCITDASRRGPEVDDTSDLIGQIASAANENIYFVITAVRSLEAFRNHPFELQDIAVGRWEITYKFEIEGRVRLTCRDCRWEDSQSDFEGRVVYDGSRSDVEWRLQDGWIYQWKTDTEDMENAASPVDAHEQAIKADAGYIRKNGLNFSPENWTDTLRKLFFYVPFYDVRPSENLPSHSGLYDRGAHFARGHLWVHVDSAPAAESDGVTISTEPFDIDLHNVTDDGWHLVEIGGASDTDDRFTATPIHMVCTASVIPEKGPTTTDDTIGTSKTVYPSEVKDPGYKRPVPAQYVYYVATNNAERYHSHLSCPGLRNREGELRRVPKPVDGEDPAEISHLRACELC